jgi:hypothetical protein
MAQHNNKAYIGNFFKECWGFKGKKKTNFAREITLYKIKERK